MLRGVFLFRRNGLLRRHHRRDDRCHRPLFFNLRKNLLRSHTVLFELVPVPLLAAALRMAPRLDDTRKMEYRSLETQKPKTRPPEECERHRGESIVVAFLADERHNGLQRVFETARTRDETFLDQLLRHLEEQRNFPRHEQYGVAAAHRRYQKKSDFDHTLIR